MQRTLIAVFDKHSDAQSAIDELVSSGFSHPQIRLSEGDPTGGASAIHGDQAAGAPRSSGSLADGIRNFLGTIFGTDNSEHVQQYSDAVTRGHHVLTLIAGNESEAERACAIVERFGPVDIDERAAQWRGGAAPPLRQRQQHSASASASASQQSVQDGAATMQGGQAGGAQQLGHGTSGVRVFTHEASATLDETEAAIEADDEYYLGHYTSNYAASGEQYGQYAPAYQFGADRAASERFRGRPWADVQPELQQDWESRHPGVAWERFEASVRYGWERGGA